MRIIRQTPDIHTGMTSGVQNQTGEVEPAVRAGHAEYARYPGIYGSTGTVPQSDHFQSGGSGSAGSARDQGNIYSEQEETLFSETAPPSDIPPSVSSENTSGLFATTRSVQCKICFGYVKIGTTAFECNCGQIYHPNCGARVGKCPSCGEVITREKTDLDGKGLHVGQIPDGTTNEKKRIGPRILGTSDEFDISDIYLIYIDGRLIRSVSFTSSLREGMDEDIMSGMLTATTSFIKDSFNEQTGGLKSLQYGKMTIYLERGVLMYLALVFRGQPSEDIRKKMRTALMRIWEKYAPRLKVWDGSSDGLEIIGNDMIEYLGIEKDVTSEDDNDNNYNNNNKDDDDDDDDYQPPKFTGDILTSDMDGSELPNIVTTVDVSTRRGCYHLYNMLLAKKGSTIRVGPDTPQDVIRKARREIIMMYHPDRWQSDKEKATIFMQKVNVAWELLSAIPRD